MMRRVLVSLLLFVGCSMANNLHVANSIYENEPVGSEAADLDKMLHGSVYGIGEREYQLVETKLSSPAASSPTNPSLVDELFALEDSRLAIKTPIDREAICPHVKTNSCILETSIFVRQKEPNEAEFMLVLETTIRDVNDNEPSFPLAYTGNLYRLNVTEGDPVGTKYALPEASDFDSNDFGIKSYRIEGPAESLAVFRLVTETVNGANGDPALELMQQLDRESTPHLQLKLVVSDKGVPALSSTLTVDVQVLDENDNTPQFEKMEYLESLQESYDLNGAVTNVRATDRDEGENARVSYFIDDSANSPNERGMFVIPNPSVGQVRLAKPLDYEQWPEHRFKVVAVDHGKIARTGSTLVTIRVLDVNDQPPAVVTYPTVPNEANEIRVKENSPINTAVAVIKIKEPDGATSQQVSANSKNVECHIQEQEIPRSFYLASIEKGSEYILKSNTTFDREIKPTINVQIQCVNKLDAGSRLATSRDVVVHIVDENDNAPIFEQGTYQTASFLENSQPGSIVHKFIVTDDDEGANGDVSFSLLQPADKTSALPFTIDSRLGTVTVTDVLDRETKESYALKVIAKDSGVPSMTSTSTLVVNLIDENDNSPEFERKVYNFLIPSDVQPPYRITQFSVGDADTGDNAIISMRIDDQSIPSSTSVFSIEPSGAFFVNAPLPQTLWTTSHPSEPVEVKVIASDSGSPKRESSALARLYLVNRSDSSLLLLFPTKNNYTLPVSIALLKSALGLGSAGYQSQLTPPAIGQVVAVTDDNYISQGAYLTYELLNSNSNQQQATIPGASPILFRINKTTGAIYVDTVAMAAASQQQQQVPVVVNPGDRYSLAVVIRLSVPPFNKTFAIERFNRLDIVFQDIAINENRVIGDMGPTGAGITGDLRNIGLVVGLAIFAGMAALFVLFLVVICRRRSRSQTGRNGILRSCASGVLGAKALKTTSAKGVVGGCATGNTSPCGSSSSKTTTDTKPLSVDIMGSGTSTHLDSAGSNTNSLNNKQGGRFENSMFPVERLKLSCSRIDEESGGSNGANGGQDGGGVYSGAGTMRRGSNNNGNKMNGLVGVATPRVQRNGQITVEAHHGQANDLCSPATFDDTTSPVSENSNEHNNANKRGNRVGNECSSSSIVSNSSTNSALSTGVSSAGSGAGGQQQHGGSTNGTNNLLDQDSGRGTEEPPSSGAATMPRPILIGIMKSPMPPPRPSGLYQNSTGLGGSSSSTTTTTVTSNCDRYHVYPRVPPQHRSQQFMADDETTITASYRVPTSAVTSPEQANGAAGYFVYANRHHHSDHYLLDDAGSSTDDMSRPLPAQPCPIHGALDPSSQVIVNSGSSNNSNSEPQPPPPPPPYRSCPVHGIVIPAGGEATFSPASILRNHHQHQYQHQHYHQPPPPSQQIDRHGRHLHGTML